MATGKGAFASFSQITESLKDIESGKQETVTEKIYLDGDVREIKNCPHQVSWLWGETVCQKQKQRR